MQRLYFSTLFVIVILVVAQNASARSIGSFDLDVQKTLVPLDEIHSGGPPKDGIPAIDNPDFIAASDTEFLKADDRVMGMELNGIAKAYPISIMNWHEIVNDRFGEDAVVVTYCPLCGSGVAFDATVDGDDLSFGVSGLLYNSDVLLYDRETESLWSQIMAKAVSGEKRGKQLRMIPLLQTTWAEWKQLYPNTLVLSRDTGYWKDYDRNPYEGYENGYGIYFPVKYRDRRYHPKEPVIGVEVNGQYKAYPFIELSKMEGRFTDHFAGKKLRIEFNSEARSARVFDTEGKELPAINAFWFAWYAFHPDTDLFKAGD